MTELLEQAIETLQGLPESRQDELASRILARIEHEQRAEVGLLADLDEGIAAAEAGDVTDGAVFMAELQAKVDARQ